MDEWKGLVKTKYAFAETFKIESFLGWSNSVFSFSFSPFTGASFSMLAKPYFIMILTVSKIVRLKSGDRLLAEIELFLFFWTNTIPSSGTSLIYNRKHFFFQHNLYFAVNSSF